MLMKYNLLYSERKTLSMSMKDGKLVVRAPIGISVELVEKFVLKHTKWAERAIERYEKKEKVFDSLSDSEVKKYKAEAKEYFSLEVGRFANIMGINYGRITITSAKTRFGSCSSKKNLSFSYRLMLYPKEAREYVVVHELAHTLEMNHSSRFYKIIEGVMPDYKKRRQLLK